MARYFFQDEDAAKFETASNVVILSVKRALTTGGCSTAGYLLNVLVEAKNGVLLTLEVFVKSQASASHYLKNPLGWLIHNTVRVGDMSQLWGRQEYVKVLEIA